MEVYGGGQRRQAKVTVALKNVFQLQNEWEGRQKYQKPGRHSGVGKIRRSRRGRSQGKQSRAS
jgi:hypothetical protein